VAVRYRPAVAILGISRSRPSNRRLTFPKKPGGGLPGAKKATPLASHFAAVQLRRARGDCHRSTPRPEESCLIEWSADETEPTKYFLSTLPATISLHALVNPAKLRWEDRVAIIRISSAGLFKDVFNANGHDGVGKPAPDTASIRASISTRHSACTNCKIDAHTCRARKRHAASESQMRAICMSGLTSGDWRRSYG
jgi:hypothetical protein